MVIPLVGILIEAHIVENKKLGLGPDVGGVGQAGALEIGFRLAGDVAGVARVILAGNRVAGVQINTSVRSAKNGSTNAVSGTGFTSMSDSLITCQPRMLEPSNPSPFSNVSSFISRAGTEKCCQRPGKSMKRRSTTSIFSF